MFSARCRFFQLCIARLHVACVALAGFGFSVPLSVGVIAPAAVTSARSSGKFTGRAQASGLRSFGKCAWASPSPASFPPNKSFKPTPCLGFVEINSNWRNTGSPLPRSARLNSGVRRQKSVWLPCFKMLLFPASVGAALRSVSRRVASSVKFVWRAHTSRALRSPAPEAVICVVMFSAADAVASETPSGEFPGARSGLPASVFGKYVGARFASASTAT